MNVSRWSDRSNLFDTTYGSWSSSATSPGTRTNWKKKMGIGLHLLSNQERLVDALKQSASLRELLALRLARRSCFYHRARRLVADRDAGARRVIADIFERSPLLRLSSGARSPLRHQLFILKRVVRRLMRREG